MTENNSYVYVLVYPELKAVKVGKADDVGNRIKQLCHWGHPDFDKSYIITINSSEVYKLEGALHLYLEPFKKIMDKKHGYSEFFNIEALDEIPKLLNFFNLKKEKILAPSVNEEIDIFIRNKINSNRFKNGLDRRLTTISDNLNVFNNIKRCLFLMKLKNIECRVVNDQVIISSSILSLVKKKNIGLCGINIVSMTSKVDVYIDIYSIINAFNKHCGSFVMKNGFSLSFFCSFFIDCYDFLKKDLPNESELPKITLNKNNELVISN
ncbi:TPA: GIY-YIG nuclease family protein [Providencia alcalifaciens]